MKKIRYEILGYTDVFDPKTGETEQKPCTVWVVSPWSAETEEKVQLMGSYEVYEEPEAPTRMDALEAQAAYTAMMTDTLLEA